MEKGDIIAVIRKAVLLCDKNTFAGTGLGDGPMWDQPLVGFAAGKDPLFAFFKEDIGEGYWSPSEAFLRKYPEATVEDRDLTVISLGFPQTKETRETQSRERAFPSRHWQVTRNRWRAFIQALYADLEEALVKGGIPVACPDLLGGGSMRKSETYVYASNWSHRHAAMAAGLGTFGLSEGLITQKGKAMRFATLIVKASIEADQRDYATFRQWCRFYMDGSCGACIGRCPAGAITRAGHNKSLCAEYLEEMQERYAADPLFDSKEEIGCGLCQAGLPCDNGFKGKVI